MTDDRDKTNEDPEKIIEADFNPEDPDDADIAEDAKEGLVVATDVLPSTLPIIPLRPRPAFPGILTPMVFTGEKHVALAKRAVDTPSKMMGLVLAKEVDEPDSLENLHRFGVVGRVMKVLHTDDDSIHLLVNCLERFSIRELTESEEGLFARVDYHYATELSVNPELKAYSMAIITTLKELVQINPLYSEEIKMFLNRQSMDDPGRLTDFAANLTSGDGQLLQEILETIDVRNRIDKVLVLLKKELEVSRLQTKISKQIEQKVSAQQREFFLREQLKAIKKELGLEKEGKVSEIEKYQKRLKNLTLSEEAQKTIDEEIEKLRLIEPSSPEYNVSRNYLDWLTILPWGKFSKDNYNIERARRVLDRDHYGLKDVKDRILEFIAVGMLKGDISGSILCLVGPPGVGKTSIGKSIAAALNRTFYRFSLGGMRDEAEIKGHRRTYIGAMPGRFIQAMKSAGTANPVLMLDEIDKVGASFQGDPASALLEVLDPEQNSSFRDHYLDVPFDLSNVLFVATANQLDTIPAPLLDRMEIIRLAGYILEEKLEIARRYLIPKALENHGLKKGQVTIRKDALRAIIDGYAREAGVRNLENRIKKIMRHAAMEFSQGRTDKITVSKKDVAAILGKPIFTEEEVFEDVPGVVTGLAWTSMGGATLQIEATAMPSRNKGFKQTGQLGKVMVESSDIAYSYVMAHLEEYGADPEFFDKHFVHLHVPAGATPKDGPSAGVTMATALLSMITGKPVIKKLGMTGELTLTGKVLPIGGVKEKIIAVKRIGLTTVILPEANRKDFEELPDHLRENLSVHFAGDYRDVYQVAFG
ncbi:DNA-binding ATP-dependent protease La [Syntrophotalea carbinolica DSM 2380]|uniref:Lon protease 1 n=1 Tax=Syntrophotalea carbinolica (strain DSM 2380 / NBRC 103641 / GraBd1) TaxID=338963 RepID=LON1_SYNC1|nr:endopeptidase La [Syntrophotalea carbinolica]Q3A701.1 RecName: Full=Lon protease 1; AltName: Full=ATP-dependent protease La 1 [Syntrophotalea carbinolica DSM 2380]ABA87850.1 DNA-binding ATP-dependent protease La [Syntrophotalea carbinolica DSM 2380]